MENTIKTFNAYLTENEIVDNDLDLIKEGLQEEWTPELEARVNEALDAFVAEYQNEDGTFDIERLNEEMTNEGILGTIIGGLTGFALGKSVGQVIARVLGVEKGILYDLLTSRLVGTALGASIGKRF
jgi:hypothetical protein